MPMLLAIHPFPYYTLRTVVVLCVFAFLVWFHKATKRSWLRGVEKICEKCDLALTLQLEDNCKPAVGWGVRCIRRMPWRIISR